MPDQNPNPNPNPDQNPNPDPAGGGAAWLDTFPTLKGDAALAKTLGGYQSAEDAFKALAGGPGADWREKIAGDDKAKLADLQRYSTLNALVDGLFDAKKRIRSGEILKPLPANATAQEVTEFRKALGIPEAPDGYLANLPEGLVIGEEDKPLFTSFAKALHDIHAPPAIAHAAVKWYNALAEQSEAEQQDGDRKARAGAEEAMREEWGRDYQQNRGAMRSFLDTVPAEVKAALESARADDGTALFSSPLFLKWFAQLSREQVGVGTIVLQDGKSQAQTIDEEINKIEKFMRTNRKDYNEDAAMQQRFQDLIAAKQRLQARQGKAA